MTSSNAGERFSLNNRVFLVTGASSGIGRSCCEKIDGFGGSVVAIGRDEAKLVAVLKGLRGNGHRAVVFDLTDIKSCQGILSDLPSFDGVIHSAGTLLTAPVKFMNYEKAEEVFKINFQSFTHLMQGILNRNLLKKNASVVAISSVLSKRALLGNSMYAASKAALESFVRSLAIEVARSGTRVNAVAPGIVRTPMKDQMNQWFSPEQLEQYESRYPLGFGAPEDVANLVLFLLSDAARWISGSTITIDGGFTASG